MTDDRSPCQYPGVTYSRIAAVVLPLVVVGAGILIYREVTRSDPAPPPAAPEPAPVAAAPAQTSPTAKAFEAIYRDATWGKNADDRGHSGTGSTLHSTVTYRAFLQQFLADHQIKSVVDAGCGDWEFSQSIDWTGIDYKGYDIVAEVIDGNRKYVKPNIQFFVGNIVDDELPPADLLISKHVLQHFPDAMVKKFLRQLPKYRHVLLINGVDAKTMSASHQDDIEPGGYRALDVTRPPFDVDGTKVLTYWDGHHMHQVVHVANRPPS
jgi:SAM-dependent methyltransferase